MRVAIPLINPASLATELTFSLIMPEISERLFPKRRRLEVKPAKTPLAEKEGFEPSRRFHDLAIFKTALLNPLSTSPH
jgi:hypothetical protein